MERETKSRDKRVEGVQGNKREKRGRNNKTVRVTGEREPFSVRVTFCYQMCQNSGTHIHN